MSRIKQVARAVALVLGVTTGTGTMGVTGVTAQEGRSCLPTGSLGIAEWSIRNGSVTIGPDGARAVEFRTEPEIRRVRAGGPADGRLRRGDILVRIDGNLVTTPAGWRALESVEPGDRVSLGIRRDGREQSVRITADAYCRPRPPAPRAPRPGRAPLPRAAPDAARPGLPPLPALPDPPRAPAPSAAIFGLELGFSFQCERCYGRMPGSGVRSGERPIRWEFHEPPVVGSVLPGGPAHEAGIRSGDVLTTVDGASITSEDGWRRFSEIEPGTPVRFGVDRGGNPRGFTVTPRRRSDVLVLPDPPVLPDRSLRPTPGAPTVPRTPADENSTLRFSEVLRGVAVEVRGDPANTYFDADTGELIIRAAGTWIRLRLPERSASR